MSEVMFIAKCVEHCQLSGLEEQLAQEVLNGARPHNSHANLLRGDGHSHVVRIDRYFRANFTGALAAAGVL